MTENKENGLEELSQDEINELSGYIDKNPKQVCDILEQRSVITLEQMEHMFSGPLPHPDVLKGYQQIDSSFPDRIFKLTERDQEHRIELEKYAIQENYKANKRGTNSAFIIAIVSIIVGAILIYNDKNTAGLVAILTPLVGLIAVFVKSEKDKKENNS